jgi:hypothetical protein
MSILDRFKEFVTGLTSPADDAFSISPSNTDYLPEIPRAIYVGGAGDLKVITKAGTETTFKGVPAGACIPQRVKKVFATGTTATFIVGMR